MKPDEIWDVVISLMEEREKWTNKEKYQNLSKNDFIKIMMKDFEELYHFAPTLFEKCCVGDFEKEDEFNKLVYMLEMVKVIENKEDTYENVNKRVGEKFAEEYVNPIVEKLEEKRKKEEEEKKKKITEIE